VIELVCLAPANGDIQNPVETLANGNDAQKYEMTDA